MDIATFKDTYAGAFAPSHRFNAPIPNALTAATMGGNGKTVGGCIGPQR